MFGFFIHISVLSVKCLFFFMYFNKIISFQLFTVLTSRTYQLQRKILLPTARVVQVSDTGILFCF